MSGRTRAIVAAALAVAAVVALVVAFTGEAAPASTSAGRLATPMWSVRRVPQPVVDAVGAQHLQRALDQSFGGAGSASSSRPTATCSRPQRRHPAHRRVDPEAARGGGDAGDAHARVHLRDEGRGAIGADNGSVDKVWLVGSGDPVLATSAYAAFIQAKDKTRGDVTTSLDALADAIVAKGVQKIPGGIVVDDSRYDTERYRPSWKPEYHTSGDIGPLGALTVNDGFSSWDPRKVVVDDPAVYAGTQLQQLLKARGVQVGSVTRGTAPADTAAVVSVASPPLKEIVTSMLRSSDNLSAELLVKELGAGEQAGDHRRRRGRGAGQAEGARRPRRPCRARRRLGPFAREP